MQDAIAVWAHQRARVEEEVSRRQESIRYASQTALLHSRPATAVHAIAEEGSMMGMSSARSPGLGGTARSGRGSVARRSPNRAGGADVSMESEGSDDDEVERFLLFFLFTLVTCARRTCRDLLFLICYSRA